MTVQRKRKRKTNCCFCVSLHIGKPMSKLICGQVPLSLPQNSATGLFCKDFTLIVRTATSLTNSE